jgi:uncharacterized membrane protein
MRALSIIGIILSIISFVISCVIIYLGAFIASEGKKKEIFDVISEPLVDNGTILFLSSAFFFAFSIVALVFYIKQRRKQNNQ